MEEFACAKIRFCLKVFIETMGALSLERILAVGLLLALGLGSLGAEEGVDKLSEQEIEKLDGLRLDYDLARGEIGIKEWVEPMEKLRKGYREKMQKVQDGFAEAKDLKKAIAARTAAKNDPTMASVESEVKEIADIQKIFIATQKKIQQRLDESLAKLARSYVSELSLIKIRLTKLNRLESAQVLEQMINQIKEGTRLYEPAELHSGQRNLFNDAGLVAYYPLNGNARDESGNGNHGAVRGLNLTNDRHNRVNKAYAFPGQNGKNISLGSSPSFSINGDMTVSAWAKFKGGMADPRIISHKGSPSWVIGTQGTGDSRQFFVDFPGLSRRLHSARSYKSEVWYHVVVVKSKHDIGIYVSGLQSSTSYAKAKLSGSHTSKPRVGPCWIGQEADHWDDAWGGALDDIRIYNRALSKKEVMDLYGLESSRFHP